MISSELGAIEAITITVQQMTSGGETTKLSIPLGNVGPSGSSSKPTNLELLMAKAKPSNGLTKPVISKTLPSLLFDDDDASAPGPSKPNLLAASHRPAPKPSGQVSRAERRAQTQALQLDANIFDYDSVYDGMKAAERKVEEAKKAETEERKPKYIENFLASAQTRRLDRLRAEEKMLSLEREKEGDEFKDKEKFVTDGYKKQMEEVRKAEEEEKKRDGECDS
jgi:coiled-coil domain-containing protein 55